MSGFPAVFSGARFAVLGLGRNGLPAAIALAAMGAEVWAWDDGPAARAAAESAGVAPRDPSPILARCDGLVLSPGIPHRLPAPHPLAEAARTAGVPIICDAELLYRAVRAAGSRARFVGITGTNGKSTTTALLAHLLAEAGVPVAAGGNLGPAALALPFLPDDGIFVLEMSSYMLERIETIRFDAAAMLNLSPDHLDRHGDMAGYAAAKREIFARQAGGDTAVIGVEDAPSRAIAESLAQRPGGPRIVRIAGAAAADVSGADVSGADGILRDGLGEIVDLRSARALPGAHNAQNAAAAAALARALGLSRDDIARGITSFAGLAHRQERVGTVDGVVFINDSKATNADSTARALACHERVVWIAGGIAKAGGIESLAPLFARIDEALLIGRDAETLAATLAAHHVPHRILGSLDRAVPEAHAAARRAAGVVLLSPACASFDQFSGFEARGDRFRALVAALAEGRAA